MAQDLSENKDIYSKKIWEFIKENYFKENLIFNEYPKSFFIKNNIPINHCYSEEICIYGDIEDNLFSSDKNIPLHNDVKKTISELMNKIKTISEKHYDNKIPFNKINITTIPLEEQDWLGNVVFKECFDGFNISFEFGRMYWRTMLTVSIVFGAYTTEEIK